MTISRLLGATMIAGALATGGAAAGITSAGAATTATSTMSTQSSTPATPTTPTTPTTPAKPTRPSPTQKSGSPSGKPCPNMGSHSGTSPNAGSAYTGAPPVGATAQ